MRMSSRRPRGAAPFAEPLHRNRLEEVLAAGFARQVHVGNPLRDLIQASDDFKKLTLLPTMAAYSMELIELFQKQELHVITKNENHAPLLPFTFVFTGETSFRPEMLEPEYVYKFRNNISYAGMQTSLESNITEFGIDSEPGKGLWLQFEDIVQKSGVRHDRGPEWLPQRWWAWECIPPIHSLIAYKSNRSQEGEFVQTFALNTSFQGKVRVDGRTIERDDTYATLRLEIDFKPSEDEIKRQWDVFMGFYNRLTNGQGPRTFKSLTNALQRFINLKEEDIGEATIRDLRPRTQGGVLVDVRLSLSINKRVEDMHDAIHQINEPSSKRRREP